tara:strand:- start:2193 stop:3230 length:1038 start_codon:yes stop_codon:yes gene_type:complete
LAKEQITTDSGPTSLYKDKLLGLQVMHVPTGKVVEFRAFLTAFTDTYNSNWNAVDVYGRMDPIATFQGTTRQINVVWNVPAYSSTESEINLSRASLFLSMLYPAYSPSGNSGGGAGQISAAPLLKVKFANLICDSSAQGKGVDNGLLGFIQGGVVFQPNFDEGFYDPAGRPEELYPMSFSLGFNLTVLHTHELGWKARQQKSELRSPGFPYKTQPYSPSNNLINSPAETENSNDATNLNGDGTAGKGSANKKLGDADSGLEKDGEESSINEEGLTGKPTDNIVKQQKDSVMKSGQEAAKAAAKNPKATAAKSTGPPPLPKNWQELPYNDKNRVAYRKWYKARKGK